MYRQKTGRAEGLYLFLMTALLTASVYGGEWKTFEVIARGNHLINKINGRVMVDIVDEDPQKRRFSGILAFQLHAGPPMKAQFRNVRIKR